MEVCAIEIEFIISCWKQCFMAAFNNQCYEQKKFCLRTKRVLFARSFGIFQTPFEYFLHTFFGKKKSKYSIKTAKQYFYRRKLFWTVVKRLFQLESIRKRF